MQRIAILAALACSGCGVVTYTAEKGARVVVEPQAVRVYQDGIERCRVTAPKVEVQK